MENTAETNMNNNLVSKVPMLKSSEYDMWKLRIKQYVLLTDYAIWDIIENGPSENGKLGKDGVRIPPKTTEEKKDRQLELKALSTLLLAIPNNYQYQFINCTDAQMLWNALEKRFSGTKSTKRNLKDILKQRYENFTSLKNESLTQIFDRFITLRGELATVGVHFDNDDLNRKFLRSLGDEWTIYTVSFRQNDSLEDKDLDDLYNDLRIFESEIEAKRRTSTSSFGSALLSASTDSFKESVGTAGRPRQESSNEAVFDSFFASHGSTSLINDDLEQINAVDLEEMDIKWQMAMLSMRVKRFIQTSGRNNFSQRREDGVGFDKSKVECYKCHKLGHFARECRGGAPQSSTPQAPTRSFNSHQQTQNGTFNRNSSQALVSQQGMGFDWSDQAEEAMPNQALMAECSELPTEVNSNLCSKTCKDTVNRYRDHNQGMSDNLKRLEKDIKDYIRIVKNFESKIEAHLANEEQHSFDRNYWKWEKKTLEQEVEKSRVEHEKTKEKLEKVQLDVEKFSCASKAMDSMLKAQIYDKMKHGIGYNATPPPYNHNYIPPKSDLLENKDMTELPLGSTDVDPLGKIVVEEPREEAKNISDAAPVENHTDKEEKPFKKEKVISSAKDNRIHYKQTTVVNPNTCKQCKCKQNNKIKPQQHDKIRGNQRNWNNQWAQKQGVDLSKINKPKPCFICGKLNHTAKHCYFNPINQRMHFQRKTKKHSGYRKDMRKPVENNFQNKIHKEKQIQKDSVKKWVPKSSKSVSAASRVSAAGSNTTAKSVSTASCDSTANSVSAATKVSTAKRISTANKVSTAHRVSAANSVSTADSVSTAKTVNAASKASTSKTVSTASKPWKSEPIIMTKFSSHDVPQYPNLIKTNFKYYDENGRLKTTVVWVPNRSN